MKLSKNEKVILVVFLAVLVIVFGVIAFLMPEYGKIAANQTALDDAKKNRDEIYTSLSREATIDTELANAKAEADEHTKFFYDDKFTDYGIDVFAREIINEHDLEIMEFIIAPYTTYPLVLSDYFDIPVTYPIKDSADIINGTDYTEVIWTPQYDENGKLVKPENPEEYFTYLRDKTQTVGVHDITVTIKGKKSDYIELLDFIKELPRATYVMAAEIPYSGVEDIADAEGNVTSITTELTNDSEIEKTITISFFCAETIEAEKE